MALTDKETVKQGDELYERYGKPLEAEHWGEFVAISPDGRTILGTHLAEVEDNALRQFGKGAHIFKVGPIAIGRLRSPVMAAIVSKDISTDSSDKEAFADEDAFYERYAKPLEAEHWGKIVAIAPDGRTQLGTEMDGMFFDASDALGDSFILFRVGRTAVGRI